MKQLTEQLQRLAKEPYAPLLPWGGVALVLFLTWLGIQSLLVEPAQSRVTQLETDWNNARQVLLQRHEARQTHQDLAKFMSALPTNQEFAPLALSISEEAKKYGVKLPALTYRVDKAEAGLATRALFQGTATGRYEDLRRFIYHLETFKQLLLIEDLTVLSTSARSADAVTINLQIATYLRGGAARPLPKPNTT
jgi:Tfp pilus assembly protein PilO